MGYEVIPNKELGHITLKVKKLKPEAQLPSRGSVDAAGWDLYACIDKRNG